MGDKSSSRGARVNYRLLFWAVSMALVMAACGGDDKPKKTNFDRKTLLESLAKNLIVPNFEALQSSVNDLSSATKAFTDAPNETNLISLRKAWVKSVTDFQHCSAFGFGPADLPLGTIAEVLAVFPANEAGIEANLLNPDFNLKASFARDIRGFYAVEYLIYGKGVADFDQKRKAYLNLIVLDLKSTFDRIVSEWKSTYLQKFISNDGTAAGSPISLMYNAWIKDYENLKNYKIELPAGLTAGRANPDPKLVEAYYSGISRDLIVQHFENSKNVWFGKSRAGKDLTGFRAYLKEITGGPKLIERSLTAIKGIDKAIAALPKGKLSENITASQVATLRNLLQENTANFKSSMSSLLGISITFNSGDGD